MAIIAFDIDGTLFDVITPTLNEYNLRHGTNYKPEDVTDYKVHECFNIDKKEFYEILNYIWINCWSEIRLYDIFTNVYFNKLRNKYNHKIVILTKRDIKTLPMVIDLLKKCGVTVDGIICVNNGLTKCLANVDILLDDSKEVIEEFQGIGVLIKRPYNQLYHVEDLKDFYEKIISGEIIKKGIDVVKMSEKLVEATGAKFDNHYNQNT